MLRKSLGPVQVQLISLGGVIGSGFFLGVGATLAENGSATVWAYLLGGAIVWLVAMAIGELSVGMRREGSFVSQTSELVGRPWAAGVGWSYWFNWCAYIPSEMMAGGMILHHLFSGISVIAWAALFGVVITTVNLLKVKSFGNIESALSLIKIVGVITFTVIGLGIWMGFAGNGTQISVNAGNFLLPKDFLSKGIFSFLATMVLVLVNFQGTELIALSAAETEDADKTIPKASRNVAIRSVFIYILPLVVLGLIFPLSDGNVERSVFVEVLSKFGFTKVALIFELMIVAAALSCANSGLYGAVRALYGLGQEGLAPKALTRLNSQGVPALATWLTIGVCWAFLPLYALFKDSSFYVWLLSVSGFTGAICWIAISYCQIRLRRWYQATQSLEKLSYQMPGFPYLSWLSLGLQGLCLSVIIFHPTLRTSLILGVPAFLLPFMACWAWDRSKARATEISPKGHYPAF